MLRTLSGISCLLTTFGSGEVKPPGLEWGRHQCLPLFFTIVELTERRSHRRDGASHQVSEQETGQTHGFRGKTRAKGSKIPVGSRLQKSRTVCAKTYLKLH